MNFEKKYWSEGEFNDMAGNSFTGYVGIYNDEAYKYNTEEKLFGNDKYICRINRSKDTFDRILSNELKLPYSKRDIIFAANDFLYSGTMKTAVERLEANNNYIFRNSIISNSTLPNTDYCTIFISEGDKDNVDKQGKLIASNFSTSAFSGKTAKDPVFYPQTETAHRFISRDILGKAQEFLDEKTSFIPTPEEKRDTTYDKYPLSVEDETSQNIEAKTIWGKINGETFAEYESGRISEALDDDSINIIFEALKGDLQTNATNGNILDIKNYFYSQISNVDEDITDNSFTEATDNSITTSFKLSDSRLINAIRDCTEIEVVSPTESISTVKTENINFKLYTLYFIAELLDDSEISASIKSNNAEIFKYKLEKSDFNSPLHLIKCVFEDGISYGNTAASDTETGITEIFEDGIQIDVTINNVKRVLKYADFRYSIGTSGSDAIKYKTVPFVERVYQHQYVWTHDDTSDVIFAPYTFTYKYLTESVEWLTAKNPKLVYVDIDLAPNYANFIPSDDMTANDVYAFMANNITSYNNFPDLNLNTYYYFISGNKKLSSIVNGTEVTYINNSNYKTTSYIVDNYKIENSKIQKGYKLPEDIYRDLNLESASTLLPYDKIPVVEKLNYLRIPETNLLKHNFNDITAANIIITDVVDNIANVMIFITFKNKLLIIKTKYDYSNEENNFNMSLDLNVAGGDFIELDRVNPADSSSIKFLNLNALKVYKNMLYLIDSELNMVLRYDIDLLTSSGESIETFDTSSIKLVNILQGLGDSSDKIYFNKPYSIEVTDDRAYIVDRNNNCVKAYTPGLNYLKTLKNGFFSSHDIQAVSVNPHSCVIRGKEIPANSIWIVSVQGKRIYISVLSEDIVMVYGQIEDISLISDKYSWVEEVRGLNFSQTNSNYFYLNTNKRVYKLHTSEPFYPFASISYFKQRSIVGTMKWSKMNFPWHRIPSLYGAVTEDSNPDNQVTWSYTPPVTSAEILDNKCFTLTGHPDYEGDIIFHYGILYDNSKIQSYIKANSPSFDGEMTFNDIALANLADMIKSAAILLYREGDSFISSLSNNDVKVFDTYTFNKGIEDDYINAMTFNKMLYSVVYNLLKIKNTLFGRFKAATNIDNVIVYDNLVLDDYFNKLQINNEADYFVHDNEVNSIIINRTLEGIYDLQEKIINKMQTTFMATQSYINNTSRMI